MKKKNPGYKVCILAAGESSQMGQLSEYINTAVLPVNFKAVISYIVEKFPAEIEFVVAVGHRKDTVTDYLNLAHPDRKFTFVSVDKYAGPGSGPGHSLLACRKHLKGPFIVTAADTIVLEDVPAPDYNWIGIAPVRETEKYCTVKIKNNAVSELDVKVKTDNKYAWIGLAGVNSHEEFFSALELDKKAIAGEVQITNGLQALIVQKLTPVGFTWFDTGSLENYSETNKNFSGQDKFDFSKGNEFLYFVGNRVIKFFADKDITDKRHKRSLSGLKGLTPKIAAKKGHFYAYEKVDGNTLYSVLNEKVVADFLAWVKKYLWKPKKLAPKAKKAFDEASMRFYKDKTMKRMAMFREKAKLPQETTRINGIKVPSAGDLLAKVDWEHIAAGIPSTYHGDLQFDNVLLNAKPKGAKDQFVLLDWRHEFGGSVETGDLYYDLAKLYGGMILSYPLIKEGMFSHSINNNEAFYHFFVKSDLQEARERYEQFLIEEGYDLDKVKILTALIFLNMAPLHNGPFDLMLYHMGRRLLHKSLGMR